MKELSIEEKAKAYDEIIEKATKMHNENCYACKACIEELIPELAESEDEMIRKDIVFYIVALHKDDEERARWIAWLEKQGNVNKEYWRGYREGKQEILDKYSEFEKQCEPKGKSALEAAKEEKVDNQNCVKPTDRVEPKFKVGDWIIHNINTELANSLMLVTDKVSDKYLCKYRNGQCSYNIEFIDKEYKLWTIQDAKDGDVLAYENEIFIVKKSVNLNIIYYCCYDREHFIIDSIYSLTIDDIDNIRPATKEQRDLLFSKIKEAGYEWDAEKKELKKIEQKPVWSEEDEDNIFNIVGALDVLIKREIEKEHNGDRNASTEYYSDLQDWLKSLRPQNNITDEELAQAKIEAYNDTLDKIEYHSGKPTFNDGWSAAIWYFKKRNAQPQNKWKPSLSQLNALGVVAKGNAPDDIEEINSLYNDLKKL